MTCDVGPGRSGSRSVEAGLAPPSPTDEETGSMSVEYSRGELVVGLDSEIW